MMGKDLITQLPEEIISQILSRLPISEAVRTCQLSKKWENMWTTTSDLEFHYTDLDMRTLEEEEKIMEFVKQVLLRCESSLVKGVSFAVYQPLAPSLLESSISYVFQWRSLERLYINCYNEEDNFSLNLSNTDLFDSLVDLDLRINTTIIISDSFLRFPKLKSLCISGLTISNNFSDMSDELHIDAPILKIYVVENHTWLYSKIYINSPSLENFHSYILEDEHVSSFKREFNVFSPRLSFFHYCGDFSEEFVLSNPSAVLRANFMFQPLAPRSHEVRLRACEMIRQFSSLRKLMINDPPYGDYDLITLLPPFTYLTSLNIAAKFLKGASLLKFLHNAPMVRKLKLFEASSIEEFELLTVPDCVASRLEVVWMSIEEGVFHRSTSFVEYILKNAKCLKKIRISALSEDVDEMKKKVMSFPITSSDVKIKWN